MALKTNCRCNFYSESSSSSDCESSVTGFRNFGERKQKISNMFSPADSDKFILVNDDEKVYSIINQRFVSCLGDLGKMTTVVAIHKYNWNSASCILRRAKLQNFQICSQAVAKKRASVNGNGSNVKYAWFGTSKEGVSRIMNYGFGIEDIQQNNDALLGRGVYLHPDHCPLESVKSAVTDENGLQHVVLCRVILGNQEHIHPYPNQSCPSSEQFDSGTDDPRSPKHYVLWSTNMNTHILPEYVISFRVTTSRLSEEQVIPESPADKRLPTSPWMPFTALIPVLAKFLPPPSINLIQKNYKEHRERRISRQELVRRVRNIAGDELLIAAIKSYRAKNIC